MAFEFKNCKLADSTEIKGLYEIQPKIFGDARGYFLETYSERDFFLLFIVNGCKVIKHKPMKIIQSPYPFRQIFFSKII